MMSRSIREGRHDQRSMRMWQALGLVLAAGVIWVMCAAKGWAVAAEVAATALQGMEVNPLPGNRVQIRFKLSGPPKASPANFTVNEPARIVLDFLETASSLSTRQQAINIGAAEKISVLEGGDRTRASVSLSRLVPYTVQVQGSVVLLTLEGAATAPAKTPAPTPAATVKTAVTTARSKESTLDSNTGAVALRSANVSDVGFKRGPDGQGVVTIKLSHPNIPIDVRQEGQQIVADFQAATLKRGQERLLDVTDFATPVATVEAVNRGNTARLTIKPNQATLFEYLAYQADDLYVVEVRPPKKSKEEEEKEAKFDPSKKKYTGDLLTLNFQDIEIRAILQILADFTGMNVVVSDTVKGNLTLRLQNVPWDQALDLILRTKHLAMRQNGNVIFIAPAEEVAARERLDLEANKVVEELTPLRTEIIQVNYAKAVDLAKLFKAIQEENKGNEKGHIASRGTTETDERTNSLVVKDTPDKIAEMRALITKLDVPTRQVLIDSRVVIASDNFAKDLGARFGVSGVKQAGQGVAAVGGNLFGTDTIVNSAVGNLINTGQPFPTAVPPLYQRIGVNLPAGDGSAPSLAFAILGADYLLDLELSALQTEGNGEVVSNPRVLTADLKKATIVQGEQIPYPTSTVQAGLSTTTIEWKDALLKLEVTPQITPDDRVRMTLKISKDARGEEIRTNGLVTTAIDKREVETEVLVNNGETVVLGGVFEQAKLTSKDKVPLLGDIPLLGYLFQRNHNATAKRELLIFVTPQIVKNGTAK